MARPSALVSVSTVVSLILCACSAIPAQPTPTPTVTQVLMTETPTPSPTQTPTLTPSPTYTPTALPPFVPDGFEIGELGLLKDPASGQNALRLNPEADWAAFRQLILENIWQANHDWARLFGLQSGASQISKEQFLKKALEGEELRFGIPIRADTKGLENATFCAGGRCGAYAWKGIYSLYPGDIQLVSIKARLDKIYIQVVDFSSFKQYTGGKDWTSPDQEAYSPLVVGGTVKESSCTAIHFAERNGFLVITLGSYSEDAVPHQSRQYLIGNFAPDFHGKYPSYYREDGLGVQADYASSVILGMAIDELHYFRDARHKNFYGQVVKFKRADGTFINFLGTYKITINHFDDAWNDRNMFVFSQ